MLKFSILFLILSILVNTVLMKYQINNIFHDLTRLCVIVAFILLIVSFFKKKK